MARKKASHPAFIEYEKSIVANPAYADMPDIYGADGGIQWEAPSNRGKGQFQFTHDLRLQWWKDKAQTLGISTEEKAWISKVAKRIHPTKKKPCAVCGRIMDIRYCYLNHGFITALEKRIPYIDSDEIEYDECTSILDFVTAFAEEYGEDRLRDLADILECKAVREIPVNQLGADVSKWLNWLENVYIPAEPSRLSPGSMSNAPDRLDGFHTYNRCCRSKQDSGRSKKNLKSYTTDRRVFEFWVDGNWITANKAMGIIRREQQIQNEPCFNQENNGDEHAKPITADHIGPISLGFCHRPVFRLLCQSCNSQKNNRMYLSDVEKLKEFENKGEIVTSWYATPIWNALKDKVRTGDDALKLSRIMRDNRYNALYMLNKLYKTNIATGFMISLLHLEYADKQYKLNKPWTINDSVASFTFSQKPTALEYATIQKVRRIRIGFESLKEYSEKDKRNGLLLWNTNCTSELAEVTSILSTDSELTNLNEKINDALEDAYQVEGKLKECLSNYETTSIKEIVNSPACIQAKSILGQMMQSFAQELSSKWEDPRYARDVYESNDSQ